MFEIFGRQFDYAHAELLQELNTLEVEGVVYAYMWQDEDDDIGAYTRLRLTPAEIVDYVDAATAYEEFLKYYEATKDLSIALNRISNSKIRRRVEEYNEWTVEQCQPDTMFCFAAFLGDHLEALTCSIVPGRHEILGQSYTGDRRFLLQEILAMFSHSVTFLDVREGGRPAYKIEKEQDVRDLLYSIVKCVFPDAELEESTQKHAGGTKRIDIVIPLLAIVIEIKFVRDARHAKRVADELKIDFESYHTHPCCKTLFAYVWDGQSLIIDRSNFIKDLRGLRVKGEHRFNVEVIIKP
jgi:REase_DpnII-MboI